MGGGGGAYLSRSVSLTAPPPMKGNGADGFCGKHTCSRPFDYQNI